jgi:ubiquinone biosynthesis protein UbiJ
MTRKWVEYYKLSSVSPAMAPAPGYPNELLFSRDRHFELHGEIMMFVLVAIFSLFILFLVILPCLKRASHQETEYAGSVTRLKCPLPWLRNRRRMDDVTPQGSVQGESEVSRKFPQLTTSD